MSEMLMVIISILIGTTISLTSVFIGIWLSCRMIGKGGVLPFAPDPKGEAFTIEDIEDAEPFPVEEDSKAQEHILERTNKFLQTLGGK